MSVTRKTRKLLRNPRLFIIDYREKRKPLPKPQLRRLSATLPSENSRNSSAPKQGDAGKVPRRYPRVATGEVAETLHARLQVCCRQMCIPFMVGGTPDPWMLGFHLVETDLRLFAKMLTNWFDDNDRLFIKIDKNVYPIKEADGRINTKSINSFDILCVEQSASTQGGEILYSSIIHVMLWEKHASYSSESIFSIREKNPYVYRLRESYFNEMMGRGGDVAADRDGHLYDYDFPIDAVFTWVDGSDPEWQHEKQKYSGSVLSEEETASRALAVERFRNRDELRYAIRSIELYAPFIRHIYLVTCGQKPSWLDESNPRITIVTHKEIYSDPSVLPTFNSSGIETQLHHIKGLAEHFLYFNDDFMLTDFCTQADFFYPNGTMKFFPSVARAVDADIDDTREEYLIADGNAIGLMRKEIKKQGRFIMQHCPYPCLKSYLYSLEERFQTEFDKCASSRFRSKDDLRPIAFMQYHFGFNDRFAYPDSISHRYLALYKPTIAEQFDGVLKTRRYKTICINDVAVPEERSDEVNQITIDFLNAYFPLKSSFELKICSTS